MVRTRCVVPEPDPGAEKRSPGTAGTVTGAKQKRKAKSQKQNTKKQTEPQTVVRRTLAIPHGQTTAGHVPQFGNEYTATPEQRHLGCARGVPHDRASIAARRAALRWGTAGPAHHVI